MKNKSGSRILRVFTSLFNVRAWFDWERTKELSRYLMVGFKKFFVPQKITTGESFKKAAKRLNLSEQDLVIRQQGLLRICILMLIFAGAMFCYSVYNFYYIQLKAAFLSLIVMLIGLTLAFRYHFWYFQIKQRQLGCTLHQWFKQGLMGEKQ